MSRIAFYAPLKSPEHPVPSGDRELARGIQNALTHNELGLAVELVSSLRSYDGQGDSAVQRSLIASAALEIDRLLGEAKVHPWQAWVTYHNYYRAPDLIGPTVSQHLGIPYLLIEASISPQRRHGPWADFAKRADQACSHADIILYLTERDREALVEHQPDHQTLVHFAPFLNRRTLPTERAGNNPASHHEILAVGMFRHGDKLASYRIIADVLSHMKLPTWHLSIVGDGPARREIKKLFAPYRNHVSFHGQLSEVMLAKLYQRASVFLWPGVNEAFGMVYLEAQATGLPVVAQDRPGVRDVIAPANELLSVCDPRSMAQRLEEILSSPQLQQTLAEAGREWVSAHHLLDTAASTLSQQLSSVLR